jgi:hypothetical protein
MDTRDRIGGVRLCSAMLLATLLVVGTAHAEPVDITSRTVTEGGVTWVLSVGASASQAGLVSLQDASLVTPALGDTFDGFWHVTVGGSFARPGSNADLVTDATGTTVTTATTSVAGLDVTLQFFLSRDLPVARILVSLQNPGAGTVTTQVTLAGNLGSDEDTTVEATSSGDAGLTDADRWVITSNGPNPTFPPFPDPVIGTVLFGPGDPAVRLRGSGFADLDNVVVSFQVRVPPGEIRHLMVFTQLSATPAAAAAAIATFDDNQALTDAGLLSGLDGATQARIVNWTLGFPRICADRVGC